mmetsp:Transcript_62951/g.136835  ORF Transcript_62951/g.136835 Transcript_62951/m.136835 type:complete len:116 (+) Transcript_62951:31-378(+)
MAAFNGGETDVGLGYLLHASSASKPCKAGSKSSALHPDVTARLSTELSKLSEMQKHYGLKGGKGLDKQHKARVLGLSVWPVTPAVVADPAPFTTPPPQFTSLDIAGRPKGSCSVS